MKDNIKKLMEAKKIKNLYEFAALIKESYRTLANIFKRNDCKVSILLKMCEVLECSPDEILGYKKSPLNLTTKDL